MMPCALIGQVQILEPAPLLAMLLAAGAACGAVARFVRLPRVVGYLVGGIALHYALAFFLASDQPAQAAPNTDIAQAAARPLKPIVDLALGLILFSLGGVFDVDHLKRVGRPVLRIALVDALVVFGAVFSGCLCVLLISGWMPVRQAVPLAVLLGITALATAPAATFLVFREYDAKGPTSDTALTLVGINNIASSILFFFALLVLVEIGLVPERATRGASVLLQLLMVSIGSLIVGIVLGLVLSLVNVRAAPSQTFLLFIAMLLGLSATQDLLSINFLICCLAIGAVFANVAIDPERFDNAVQTVGSPVFVAFFALAGYQLHLEELFHLGWLGTAYVVGRTGGRLLGCWLGVRSRRSPETYPPFMGTALLCQAGVAIGLASYLDRVWPGPVAAAFHTVILGSVALFELLGPPAIRWFALHSGEVKAITLMRRTRAAPPRAEGESMSSIVIGSLGRLVSRSSRGGGKRADDLTARHIMRTNVKVLRASATLDDVMRFIEQSRFNHFPVVGDENRLLGVVHFSDIRAIIYDPKFAPLITALDLADPASPVIAVDDSLNSILEVFRTHDAGCLPVVDTHKTRVVVGIVEQRDLLRALHIASVEAGTSK